MKKIILWLFIMTVPFILLFGCAKVSKAPESSSDEAKLFNTVEDKGVVYLYRTGRVVGAAGQLIVRINGIDAGGTGPGTFFRWELKPGTYTIASSTSESSATVQVNVESGKLYFFKQTSRLGLSAGRVTLKEVDEKTGRKMCMA